MTPEEQKILVDLASRIAQTPPVNRDPEADAFIRSHIGNRPDALYLMTQTVLLQNGALEQARAELDQAHAQIQQLQQQTGAGSGAPASGSFLGGARPQPQAPASYQPAPSYQQGGYQQASYPPPAYGAQPQPAGGGFLRSAAQTAAGVAGGMLAFQGMEALLGGLTHGFGGFSGGGGSSFGGFGGGSGETIIENNYYDEPGKEAGRFDSQRGDSFLGPDPHADYSGSNNDDILPSDDSSSYDSGGDDFSGDDDSGSNSF
jgi:uncharacterized protein